MAKYKKTKKVRKREKDNLLRAYKNAVKNRHLTESEAKKLAAETKKEYKQFGV